MAILKFTDKDKLASKTMPDGWYSFEVVSIDGPKKSSSGKSFNFPSKFRVIDDPDFADKELELFFNTGTKNASVMGTLQILPHNQIIHLAAATASVTIDEVPDDVDTDSLKGLKFDGYVTKTISDGAVFNTVTNFLPYGTGIEKAKEGAPF